MPCNEIVAYPTTLTGSIGVLAGKFVTPGAVRRSWGLKREPIRIGAVAGLLSSATEFSPEDWERLGAELDRIYQQFTSLAAQDRGMDYDHLESLAKGRVWTGAARVNVAWLITSVTGGSRGAAPVPWRTSTPKRRPRSGSAPHRSWTRSFRLAPVSTAPSRRGWLSRLPTTC